jgi:tetratricopeptide (TPR) repeat protein
VAERLRQAELEKAAAQAKAAEAHARAAAERRARGRTVLLLLTGALLLVGLAVAGWRAKRQADERARRDAEALAELEEKGPLALEHQEAGRYKEAEAVVQRLEGLLQSGAGGEALRPRLARLRAHLTMLANLEKAHLGVAQDPYDRPRAVPLYREAFDRYGLPVLTLEPAEAAAAIRASPIREALLAALWGWAQATPDARTQERLERVLEVARSASGAFGQRWRTQVIKRDGSSLAQLAGEPEAARLPALSVRWLSRDLIHLRQRPAAVRLLRAAQRREPGDFWLNNSLALFLRQGTAAERKEALRYRMVAVALRPQSPVVRLVLGCELLEERDPAGAAEAFRDALRLDPHYAEAHNNLGLALFKQGKQAEAIDAYRRAIQLKPTLSQAHNNLGTALHRQKKYAEAAEAFGKAIHHRPDGALGHYNLGRALYAQGKRAEGTAALRRATGLEPVLPEAHDSLGSALYDQKQYAEAAEAFRAAIRHRPNYALARYNLGRALRAQGKLEEALAELRQAGKFAPPCSYVARALPAEVRQVEQELARGRAERGAPKD